MFQKYRKLIFHNTKAHVCKIYAFDCKNYSFHCKVYAFHCKVYLFVPRITLMFMYILKVMNTVLYGTLLNAYLWR